MFRVFVFGGGRALKTKLSRERIYIEDYRERVTLTCPIMIGYG